MNDVRIPSLFDPILLVIKSKEETHKMGKQQRFVFGVDGTEERGDVTQVGPEFHMVVFDTHDVFTVGNLTHCIADTFIYRLDGVGVGVGAKGGNDRVRGGVVKEKSSDFIITVGGIG